MESAFLQLQEEVMFLQFTQEVADFNCMFHRVIFCGDDGIIHVDP